MITKKFLKNFYENLNITKAVKQPKNANNKNHKEIEKFRRKPKHLSKMFGNPNNKIRKSSVSYGDRNKAYIGNTNTQISERCLVLETTNPVWRYYNMRYQQGKKWILKQDTKKVI